MITNFTQRWKNQKCKYNPAGEVINPAEFDVSEIAEKTAKDFVITHHYSQSYPAARRRFGLFQKGELVGVAVYSHPCNERTITNVFKNERAADGLELGRFVLLDSVKANGESWFLARCHSVLKNDYVGVVSFSDDVKRTTNDGQTIFAGHLGTIYQASNAAFLGRGTARTLSVLPDGKILSDRSIQKIRSGEKGWNYTSEIFKSYGMDSDYPTEPEQRKTWLAQFLRTKTRKLRHAGNLKYAWSFSKTVKLISLNYPKIKIG